MLATYIGLRELQIRRHEQLQTQICWTCNASKMQVWCNLAKSDGIINKQCISDGQTFGHVRPVFECLIDFGYDWSRSGLLRIHISFAQVGSTAGMSCHSPCSIHCGAGLGNTELSPETPYPELLSSTAVPSDGQISTIRDVIRAVEEQIDFKYHEVARLQEVITNLNRQRAELHVFANTHIGMISGMRRLPSELLTEIFLQFMAGSGTFVPITVVPFSWHSSSETRSTSFSAAGTVQKLPIYLNFRSHYFRTEADSLNALDLFLAASTRWREVTLRLSSEDMSHLGAFTGTFPVLQTLAISNRELEASLAATFAVLPSLTDLELHCRDIPAQITFPFSSLRRCVVHDCNSTDVLRILSLLAPGAAFSVCRCRAPTNPDAVLQPTMSHIHSLHFNGCDPLFIQNVLRALVAPDLTDLTISGYYGNELAPYIIQLLSSAHCPLTRLGLTPRAALLQILAATGEACAAPLLRRLVLHGKLSDRASIMCMLRSRVGVLESVDFKLLLPNEDVEELRAHGMQVNCIQEAHQKAKVPIMRISTWNYVYFNTGIVQYYENSSYVRMKNEWQSQIRGTRYSAGLGNTELPLETSYPELLSSTTVPSDVQISTIRDVIRVVEEQIDSKCHEVARLKQVITNLNRQRTELRVFANTHIGMISGMRRLPSELLTEIFLQFIRMETSFRDPWIIATVCSRWRAVALSSPSLWCHFLGIHPRRPAALLSAQLERSRNSPIYLTFRSHCFQTDAYSLNALDLFLAASTRWREATLDLNSKDMSHLGTFAGTFPLLQTLIIRNRELGASLAAPFAALPSLTDLELHCYGIPAQITFPFSSLRRCALHDCNSTDVLRILSLLAPGAALSCGYFFIQGVLRALIAPALTDLTIDGSYDINSTSFIIQLLSNTHCPLARLGLPGNQISTDDLRRVLELSPGVVELEVSVEAQAVLHVLATTSEAPIAPLLRRLVLHGNGNRDSVMCMLRSRVGVLESVGLDFLLPDEDIEELHTHGMQVACRGHVQEMRPREKKDIALSSVKNSLIFHKP
ncbi:hypothetical protein C8J57DRAFT_1478062 [Mycena rebaudengoi]|nr:hypothetical protein C8J57DRAFT_1478062 [Mycena rebaudengoi]